MAADNNPPQSQDNDSCLSCRICRFQDGLDVYALTISDVEQVRAQAHDFSCSIFQHWILLNKILKRFELQIQKRWTKRSKSQKLTLLLQAWPHMAATHRPEFATLRKVGANNNKRRPNQEREKEACLWPHINQDDLVETQNLLVFLNSRGRHLPDKFAFGDRLQNSRKPEPSDLDKYKMCLHGQRSPKSYGSLVLGDEGDKIQQALRFEPAVGLLVLEIQERILDFLVKCCRLILHDIDFDQLDLIETKPDPPQIRYALSVPTVTAMAEIAPYRVPQKLDLGRLLSLVSAKREEAEEHVWSLREDPGYFAQVMREWSDHSSLRVLDKFKKPHALVGKPEFWNKVATRMIFHAYRNLILLGYAEFAVMTVQEKLEDHLDKLESSYHLPIDIETEFQLLEMITDCLLDEGMGDLMLGYPASPPVRSGYERAGADPDPSFGTLAIKMGKQSRAWRVQVLFRTLLSPEQQKKHGLNNTVEEIQRMLDEHSNDSDLISSWVANRFSDVALMSEIRRQLSLFQPWCIVWRSKAPIEPDCPQFFALVNCFYGFITCADLTAADPANFVYPSSKRRTQENVELMRQAERRLDQFWIQLDAHSDMHTGHPTLFLLRDSLNDYSRKLHRTKPWVEPKFAGSEVSQQQESDMDAEIGMPMQVFGCTHTKKNFVDAPPKIKSKTRPDGPTATEEMRRDSATSKEEKEVVETVKLKVNRRAFKVFATMFHVPSANEQQNTGEVAWTEFLYAMKTIGFSVEKLYGSSWQFTPDTINVGRSIQFHEPHPRAKMWYWLAKEYGRRLNRAYGWTGETFDLQ